MNNTDCKYYPEYRWYRGRALAPAFLREHPETEPTEVERRVECLPATECPFGGPFEKGVPIKKRLREKASKVNTG